MVEVQKEKIMPVSYKPVFINLYETAGR